MPEISNLFAPQALLGWVGVPLGTQAGIFCLRLACGVCWMLVLLSPRHVQSEFYRHRLYLVLGLAVLSVLAGAAPDASARAVWYLSVGVAVGSYLGTAFWLMQWQRAGRWVLAALALMTSAGVVLSADIGGAPNALTEWLGRLAPLNASVVMGAILVAMLLGHAYLVAPGMSLVPLKRLLAVLAIALLLRAALGLTGFVAMGSPAQRGAATGWAALLLVRALAGIAGPLVLVALTWQTVKIRSTQSATGILYAGVAMVFLGELTAQLLTGTTGILL